MTKGIIKHIKQKRTIKKNGKCYNTQNRTKRTSYHVLTKTRKNVKGGIKCSRKKRRLTGGMEPADEQFRNHLKQLQEKKNGFRRALSKNLTQIKNQKSSNQAKQALNSIIIFLKDNEQINTLVPISVDGKVVDKETYSLAKTPIAIYLSLIHI